MEIVKNNLKNYGKNITKWKYVNTSFLNIFPYQESTIIIIGYHKKYPCKWIIELISKLRNSNEKLILKIISDLISVKLDYWCMSPDLWESLGIENQNKLKSLFTTNFHNIDTEIETKFNLFSKK